MTMKPCMAQTDLEWEPDWVARARDPNGTDDPWPVRVEGPTGLLCGQLTLLFGERVSFQVKPVGAAFFIVAQSHVLADQEGAAK